MTSPWDALARHALEPTTARLNGPAIPEESAARRSVLQTAAAVRNALVMPPWEAAHAVPMAARASAAQALATAAQTVGASRTFLLEDVSGRC